MAARRSPLIYSATQVLFPISSLRATTIAVEGTSISEWCRAKMDLLVLCPLSLHFDFVFSTQIIQMNSQAFELEV
jgi:hypothetical protein